MSEQKADFLPRRGKREKLDDISIVNGQQLFTSDTGSLYIDVLDETQALKRIQITASDLVKFEKSSSGVPITSKLTFDQISKKLDRITPVSPDGDMTNNVVIIGPNGTVIDSGVKIDDVGLGSSIIFTEVSLSVSEWSESTHSQIVAVPNLLEDSIVIVSPKDIPETIKYNIYCSKQQDGLLEFTYLNSKPKSDIVFNIVIQGKSALEDENKRFLAHVYLNPSEWNDNIQRVYDEHILESSVITVSPINVTQAIPYNIYGLEQGIGYIDFKCAIKPEETVGYYLLIENYS